MLIINFFDFEVYLFTFIIDLFGYFFNIIFFVICCVVYVIIFDVFVPSILCKFSRVFAVFTGVIDDN